VSDEHNAPGIPEVFKREAVDRVISSGLPVGKVATELGLNETVLRRWVMRLGGQATGPARRPITQVPVASRLIWQQRMPACGARTSGCGWSATSRRAS
jgi:transposase-like protein